METHNIDNQGSNTASTTALWKDALWHGVPITLLILGLFAYWFAVADRYAIFLYGHLGATPFDTITSSRYWMAGLVACGMVLVLYTLANWIAGRMAARGGWSFRPPAWQRVWLLCLVPLAAGIPAITLTANTPSLPPSLAAACTLATLAGLALALAPGSWAAQRPVELAWLALDGAGLMPVLILFHFVELPGRGSAVPTAAPWAVAIGSLLASVAWLGFMTALRTWRHRPLVRPGLILIAGLCLSYLLVPLLHHLLLTPRETRYITASSNVFAYTLSVQLLVLALATLLDVGTTWLRSAFTHRRGKTSKTGLGVPGPNHHKETNRV
jgi:hypothetical protein